MSIFSKYVGEINSAELAASLKEINDNGGGNHSKISSGKYEVKVDKMELRVAPWGETQVAIQFRILAGDYTEQCIFYEQGFEEDWKRHRAVKMLAALADNELYTLLHKNGVDIPDGMGEAWLNDAFKTGTNEEINDLLLDLHKTIDGKFEYLLDYSSKPAKTKDNKEYTKKEYTIVEVWDK